MQHDHGDPFMQYCLPVNQGLQPTTEVARHPECYSRLFDLWILIYSCFYLILHPTLQLIAHTLKQERFAVLVNETGQTIGILKSKPPFSDRYDYRSFKAVVDASHMKPLCCHNVKSHRERKQRRMNERVSSTKYQ